jgi:hypothetical protein
MTGQRRQPPDSSRKPAGSRLTRALNPRRTPTRSRTGIAALAFLGLTIVLGALGLTLDAAYLRPAVLTALLAVLWGARALIMR